jgi:hypothetical protein
MSARLCDGGRGKKGLHRGSVIEVSLPPAIWQERRRVKWLRVHSRGSRDALILAPLYMRFLPMTLARSASSHDNIRSTMQ